MLWQRGINKCALQDTEAAELLFPVKRVENSLEGMDYCEAELMVCVRSADFLLMMSILYKLIIL